MQSKFKRPKFSVYHLRMKEELGEEFQIALKDWIGKSKDLKQLEYFLKKCESEELRKKTLLRFNQLNFPDKQKLKLLDLTLKHEEKFSFQKYPHLWMADYRREMAIVMKKNGRELPDILREQE